MYRHQDSQLSPPRHVHNPMIQTWVVWRIHLISGWYVWVRILFRIYLHIEKQELHCSLEKVLSISILTRVAAMAKMNDRLWSDWQDERHVVRICMSSSLKRKDIHVYFDARRFRIFAERKSFWHADQVALPFCIVCECSRYFSIYFLRIFFFRNLDLE